MSYGFDGVDATYDENATDPTRVVAFDTDFTVNYADGPVPLEHVLDLRERDDVLVWSTGFNQTLRDKAEIPGMYELKRKLGLEDQWVERADRMRLLTQAFPDADERVIVDDVDLRQLNDEGWNYYQPAEYVVNELGIPQEHWIGEVGIDPDDYFRRIGSYGQQLPVAEINVPNPYEPA